MALEFQTAALLDLNERSSIGLTDCAKLTAIRRSPSCNGKLVTFILVAVIKEKG